MRALSLSVLLTLAGLATMVLGLYGVAEPAALGLAGMVMLASGVLFALLHVLLQTAPSRPGGRLG